MARGPALVHEILPLLESDLSPALDGHASARLDEMRERYAAYIARERARASPSGG
jgi:hypothetical protein